ncbi:MAG: hypothetical protein HY202_00740 [Nitrospirae bacterium]|nr:hypothetical protein [Nitrospirota bacterium]MBI3604537.1 hypothetical protein [Nitrospirota bacterium]
MENNPSSGYDPNKPLPVLISSSAEVMVDHTQGAIITTPDGKAALSVSQTALSADTFFKIELYNLPSGSPRISIVQMYSFTSTLVISDTLIPGQFLKVTLYYDSGQIPIGVKESDLRLGIYDSVGTCWEKVFLDSPPLTPVNTIHSVSSRDLTRLGIFGMTSILALTCPNIPIPF